MTSRLTPKQLAKEAESRLRSSADAKTAAQARKYFKPHEKISVYGVGAPTVRRIERELFQKVREDWTINEALTFCDLLIKNSYIECKNIGILLLSRYKKSFPNSLFRTAKQWLIKDYCDNWSCVDTLAPLVIAPLLQLNPVLVAELKTWTSSKNLWVRRAAAVALIPIVRRGEQIDDAYQVARSLFDDDHDLIHKATGWMLRETGKADSSQLESFLQAYGHKMPRTALRYAIERFPKETQQRLLDSTRKADRTGK